MKYSVVVYITFFLFANASAQYVYPIDIAHNPIAKKTLLMHQRAEKKMQVVIWDRDTHEVVEVLGSYHQPSGVHMIPDGTGFSFIEDDILAIQDFSKRSPELILFDEPIYQISLVWWIDNTHYYFAARDEGRYGIYQGNRKGLVDPLLVDDRYDYLYPQKVNDMLFCVRRNDRCHQIVSLVYPVINDLCDDADEQKIISRLQRIESFDCGAHTIQRNVDVVCSSSTESIAFVSMVSPYRGFYMSHPTLIDTGLSLVPCSYYEVVYDQKKGMWNTTMVATFSIPLSMIQFSSEKGLYETVYPLLPQYIDNKLLYIDVAIKNGQELWLVKIYNCSTSTTTTVYQSSTPVMRPSIWQGRLQLGRTITDEQPFLDLQKGLSSRDSVSLIEIALD